MYARLIAPEWLTKEGKKKVLEGEFTNEEIRLHNEAGYNIYFLPNSFSSDSPEYPIDGTDIDSFDFLFVDCDLKDNVYKSKEEFLEVVNAFPLIPYSIVDSGNGIHVYWQISDLEVHTYLKLSRRLMRHFKTDEAVQKIFQLMRLPGTLNTKIKPFKACEILSSQNVMHSSEDFNKILAPLTQEDQDYCDSHYRKTFNMNEEVPELTQPLPKKFGALLRANDEVKDLFTANVEDRSKADYRLGHLLFANGFTKQEGLTVLLNTAKASERDTIHRINYAQNIIDKIWTYEETTEKSLSNSVEDILKRKQVDKGTPFRCHKRIDNTVRGFRLGDVIGLVGGSGVGKTAFGLNIFKWFLEQNPDYVHFVVTLEQPDREIAERWTAMCDANPLLNKKIHILSNYDEDGKFRNLSFKEIQDYIEHWQSTTKQKVGCVMIDHIGALAKKSTGDENQDLIGICQDMKAFAIQTNTLLIMQSQTSREKAGIGDLELNKDAAYGTSTFEWFCDYLMTLWQPLKRCHHEDACPTVTAYKFCKIRHKKKADVVKEDVLYYLLFDPDREILTDMTQDNKTSFEYFLNKSTNKRKADRKTTLLSYTSVPWKTDDTKTQHN